VCVLNLFVLVDDYVTSCRIWANSKSFHCCLFMCLGDASAADCDSQVISAVDKIVRLQFEVLIMLLNVSI